MNDSRGAVDQEVLNTVRQLVERRLGHRIAPNQWAALLKRNYPVPDFDDFEQNEALRVAVEDTVEAWKDFYGDLPSDDDEESAPLITPPRPREGEPDVTGLRRIALTALSVADARRDEEVLRFRTIVLGGNLLPGGERADEACRDWVYAAAEDGWKYYGLLLEARFVADHPDKDRHFHMPEPLRELYLLTERLGARYDWIKGAATMFVLADVEPQVLPLRAGGRVPYSWLSASRINLVVDPATTPAELAEFYQLVRKSPAYYGGAQVRPIGEKALLMAAFAAKAPEDERGVALVKRWNEQYPQFPYDPANPASVSNFRRDLRQACERLLVPKLGLEARRRAPRLPDDAQPAEATSASAPDDE